MQNDELSLEDTPVSFVNKKTLPAKNQKAHIAYLKKKKDKINNATDQKEMPAYNSISGVSEETISRLSNIYKSKGVKYISSFKDFPLCKNTINSYKFDCRSLSHVRYGDNIDGCILVDGIQPVGYVSVETKNNGQKWIQALEITKPYRGYKLSSQLLRLAIKHYGATHLSVNRDNEIAIRLYNANGFKEYSSNDTMIFMKTANTIQNHTSILEAVTNGMKPIFIVNSYTNTPAGKIIRTWTHSEYSHTALSFDTGLENLYSFNGYNGIRKLGGISKEKLSKYMEYYKDTTINVRCIFVKESDFVIVQNVLTNMIDKQDQTTYGYSNIFNILLGRAKEMTDDAMSMVCSQFVAYILRRADINITDKPVNLVTPNDLATINNPKMYLLYSGYAKNYDKSKIDRIFRKIKQKALLIKECLNIEERGENYE